MAEHPGNTTERAGIPASGRDGAQTDLALAAALERAAGKADRATASVLKRYGLTSAQFDALDALYHTGPATMRQITDRTLSTPGNMTVVVRNLERDGLLSRRKNPSDARSQLLDITDTGRRKMAEIWPVYLAQLKVLCAPLSDAEKQTLASLLEKIG